MYRPKNSESLIGERKSMMQIRKLVSGRTARRPTGLTGNIAETLADLVAKLEHGNRIALRWHWQMVRAMHAWFEVLIGSSWIAPNVPPLLGWSRAARVDLLTLNQLPAFTDQSLTLNCDNFAIKKARP